MYGLLQYCQLSVEDEAMTILIAGLLVFFAVHAIPLFQDARGKLIAGVGEMRFKGLFSIVSIAGFVGILVGMKQAAFEPVWNPPAWSASAANFIMPVAFVLLAAAYVPNNFRRVIRNPMLLSVLLWSIAHLLSNGDLASILLFGSFGLFALVDRWSVNRRSPGPVADRKPLWLDAATIAVGLGAFWLARHFHAQAFGVPVPY